MKHRSKSSNSDRDVQVGNVCVIAKANETIDGLIRRFKKKLIQFDTLGEISRRQYFEKNSVTRRKNNRRSLFLQRVNQK